MDRDKPVLFCALVTPASVITDAPTAKLIFKGVWFATARLKYQAIRCVHI